MNYPFVGTTPITINTWHHAAVTYDSVTAVYTLYLDGAPAGTLDIVGGNILPRSDSIQHAGLASAMTSAGAAAGYFQGSMDEARIWNVVRTQNEILSTLNQQITSGPGLIARWGLNEGAGGTTVSSIGGFSGILTNGPIWVAGAPFNLPLSPALPTLVVPADLATGVPTPAALTVHVTDPQSAPLTVSFYGRPKDGPGGPDFTLVAIPDPQNYASTYPLIYNAQMNWVVTNKTASNIKFVMSVGDNVNTYTGDPATSTDWVNAKTAWDILTTGGVPYGLALGNHDGAPSATANFNTAFGSRLAAAPNSCTSFGADFDNSYCTFSASGMDFIAIFIEYGNSTTEVLNWANGVLADNPAKRAIVVTHDLLSGNSFTSQGSAIYNALKGNSNLFLMLGGHADTAGKRSDTDNGHTVYSLRSDYQSWNSQQGGYLRVMRFSPADNQIHVTTYSPNRDESLTDSANQFDLAYAMDGVADFAFIGSTTVPSGSDANISWSGLTGSTEYEWYAVADNGGAATVSPTWSFTTEGISDFQLSVGKNGTGAGTVTSDPAGIDCGATCSATYASPTSVTLSAAAEPTSTFTGWSGAGCSGTGTCTVTMSAARNVTATFTLNVHSLSLVIGWNLVSFNLHPVNTAIDTVLSSIAGSYDLVYAWDATGASSGSGNWLKYDPSGPSYQNTLLDLDETVGFWIRATAPVTLDVIGSAPVTTSTDLLTTAGNWNLVGYAAISNHVLPGAFSDHGTGTDFSLVYGYHANDVSDPWIMYDLTGPAYANELTELAPGWGYWIKVTARAYLDHFVSRAVI